MIMMLWGVVGWGRYRKTGGGMGGLEKGKCFAAECPKMPGALRSGHLFAFQKCVNRSCLFDLRRCQVCCRVVPAGSRAHPSLQALLSHAVRRDLWSFQGLLVSPAACVCVCVRVFVCMCVCVCLSEAHETKPIHLAKKSRIRISIIDFWYYVWQRDYICGSEQARGIIWYTSDGSMRLSNVRPSPEVNMNKSVCLSGLQSINVCACVCVFFDPLLWT